MSSVFLSASSLRILNALDRSSLRVQKSQASLASGLRINQASDDAAGLAISEKLLVRVRGIAMARRQALQGARIAAIADGAMAEISTLLIRMRELAVHSASGELANSDRAALELEFNALRNEITRIAMTTEFNGKKLLGGTFSGSSTPATAGSVTAPVAQTAVLAANEQISFADFGIFAGMSGAQRNINLASGLSQAAVVAAINADPDIGPLVTASVDGFGRLVITTDTTGAAAEFQVSSNKTASSSSTGIGTTVLQGDGTDAVVSTGGLEIQVGDGASAENRIVLTLTGVRASDLGIGSASVAGASLAQDALGLIDTALATLHTQRATVGAAQNRFDVAARQAAGAVENFSAAASRIRDVDVADASSRLASDMIRLQAGSALLSQGNLEAQIALTLLRFPGLR